MESKCNFNNIGIPMHYILKTCNQNQYVAQLTPFDD